MGLLSRSPRHSRTVSDGNAPIVPTGAVPYYGKLDARSAFVTPFSTEMEEADLEDKTWEDV